MHWATIQPTRSSSQFSDDVPLCADVHGVPAEGVGGRPVGEAVVVLAREHEIPVQEHASVIY